MVCVAPLVGKNVENVWLLGIGGGASGVERGADCGCSGGFDKVAAIDHRGWSLSA